MMRPKWNILSLVQRLVESQHMSGVKYAGGSIMLSVILGLMSASLLDIQ